MTKWRECAAAALAVVALAAPAHGQQYRNGWSTTVTLEGAQGELRMEGPIRFTRDNRDVAAADSGARLVLMVVLRDGSTRRVEVAAGPGGRLERRYRVGGTDAPYDSAAARWLHLAVAQVGPFTDEAIRERTHRVLRERGLDSLLARLADGRARRDTVAIDRLMQDSSLAPAQLVRVVQAAARAKTRTGELANFLPWALSAPAASVSDSASAAILGLVAEVPLGERMEVLRVVGAGRAAERPLSRAAFFGGVRSLAYDDERVRVLFSVVSSYTASAGLVVDALHVTAGLALPADRARVLMAVEERQFGAPAVREAYEALLAGLPAGPERDAAAARLQAASAPHPSSPTS